MIVYYEAITAGYGLFIYILLEVFMYQNLETIDELGKRWKVKKSWLYARSRENGEGSIPRMKIGKYLRFEPEKVDSWLKKQNEAD